VAQGEVQGVGSRAREDGREVEYGQAPAAAAVAFGKPEGLERPEGLRSYKLDSDSSK
jgi:hypothetical protein